MIHHSKEAFIAAFRDILNEVYNELGRTYEGECETQINKLANSIFDEMQDRTDPRLLERF